MEEKGLAGQFTRKNRREINRGGHGGILGSRGKAKDDCLRGEQGVGDVRYDLEESLTI